MRMSKEEKAKHLENWKQSEKSAWAYAKEKGITPQTFCGWVKGEAKKASVFVEIPMQLKPVSPQQILIEKGDIKIHIPLSVWIEYPSAVIEGLKAVLS